MQNYQNTVIFGSRNNSMLHRAAIIDMGTNTFHILIIEWEGNHYKILDKLQIPVKLGKGGFVNSKIQKDAYSRGIAALIEFKSLIDSYNISTVEAYGTSALRNTSNGEQFRDEAENLLKCPVQIINGDLEAELIYEGVKHALPLGNEPHLIMDIGGGSVEFIIADSTNIYWKKSFEIGAARLIERFPQGYPMNEGVIREIETYLDKELLTLWIKAQKYQVKTMVGASGSFESLAGIEMELFHSTSQVFPFLHHILDLEHFEIIYNKLIFSPRKDLEKLPGLPQFRVDMIGVAVVMIHYVIHRLKISKVIASDYALKEGVMFRLMGTQVPNWEVTK